MKTKSPSGKISHNKERKIFNHFRTETINTLAIKSGYKKRSRGKISAKNLILGFMMMSSQKRNTYESWSHEISFLTGKTVSKQAVQERMRPETTAMLKLVLEEELRKSIRTNSIGCISNKFNHIKLEDSTIINLPEELSGSIPGNVANGKKRSQARIHALYDFTDNTFSLMSVHSYTQNDQSLATHSISHINRGDLFLRDMGFFVLKLLDEIESKGAYFISRKPYQVLVSDRITREKIDLVKLLSKQNFFDQEVLVGKDNKKMRLVILPLPPKLAAEKRRKARNGDKRYEHSKEYYQLLGYSIFITNISPEKCCSNEIAKLYALRWQIEILFKSWKSCFSIEKLIPSICNNPDRIYCMLYIWLIYILIFHTVWINYNKQYLQKNANLSIMKLARFFSDFFKVILMGENDNQLKKLMLIKCKYDKRKDRLNLMQKYENIAA